MMIIVALVGLKLGYLLMHSITPLMPANAGLYYGVTALIGAIVGYIGAPYVSVVPCRALLNWFSKVSARAIVMGVVGLLIGLVLAALLAYPLSMLPAPWGQTIPVVAAVALAALGMTIMVTRDGDILPLLGVAMGREGQRRRRSAVLLDTSVIIDGRVADIQHAGFIREKMVVPRFVLDELQHIADSPDVLRRNRGRRGLDVLNTIQKDATIPLEISERDVPDIREVDGKLIKLGQMMNCPILTNDYNLNRVAELQGVEVLNINELANSVKAVVLPGETLRIQIIQEGKELGQGVGYLDDGTMVVIEDGRRHINATVQVVVTRVLQTVAGRMIFGQIQGNRR